MASGSLLLDGEVVTMPSLADGDGREFRRCYVSEDADSDDVNDPVLDENQADVDS